MKFGEESFRRNGINVHIIGIVCINVQLCLFDMCIQVFLAEIFLRNVDHLLMIISFWQHNFDYIKRTNDPAAAFLSCRPWYL